MLLAEVIIDPWLIVLLLSLLMGAGLCWGVFRERHLADLVRERNESVHTVTNSFSLGATTVKMSLDGVAEDLRAVHHKIERAEELSETHRQELIRLVVDVERRLMDALRDWASRFAQPAQHIVTQVSTGQAAISQAGENHAKVESEPSE